MWRFLTLSKRSSSACISASSCKWKEWNIKAHLHPIWKEYFYPCIDTSGDGGTLHYKILLNYKESIAFLLKPEKFRKMRQKPVSRNLSVHEPTGNGMFTVLFCTVGMLSEMRSSWVLYFSQGEKLSGKQSEIDVQRRKKTRIRAVRDFEQTDKLRKDI